MKSSNRLTNLIAAGLLALMFFLALFSMKDISTTMDELAHIPAGYSYLSQKDYRLNPEHPPLIKDAAGVPLLFQKVNFPKNHPSWLQGVNQQWWFGNQFLYQSGNDADKIIFWSRLPMILLLLSLGVCLFHFARKIGGNFLALGVLFLFTLSPTFLAHGRLVTTDVAATFGFLLGILFYLKFLKNPRKLNIILAGIGLGVALLLKFSCILLLPLFVVVSLVYVFFFSKKGERLKIFFKYLGWGFLVLVVAVFLIWIVYQVNIWNYPIEKQVQDTKYILKSNPFPSLVKINVWMAQNKILRPLGHYLLGLMMATQRVTGGNTVYFLGEVSAAGWWYYFPVVYLLKLPLAFHLLTLFALVLMVWCLKKNSFSFKKWFSDYFTEFTLICFLVIYWFTSIKGNLNIGVRHIMPVIPFTYILVLRGIQKGYWKIKNISCRKYTCLVLIGLFSWYGFSSLSTFPHYLSYFNEIAGGPRNGYKFVVDSNYDWGQDLLRLKNWVEERNIEKIYVDYFGGGDVSYYLGEKYIPWQGTKPAWEFPKGNYLAVSVTLLQGGRGKPALNFDQPTGYYNWLNSYDLFARAGNSIFIYYID
ncbi:glycosyltransferase family 39 protein [bacterium]|nr:glycosyltransferase family 39 protein [bacterium]